MMRIKLGLLLVAILFWGCESTSPASNQDTVIVLTFDDQHESIYNFAFPLMKDYGFTGTNFVNSLRIGYPDCFTWEQLEDMDMANGWETGGHTLHHINMPYVDEDTVEFEVLQDKQNLLDHGFNPVSFALPSGHATPSQLEFLSEHYKNIRSSLDQRHIVPINRLNLGYFAYRSEHTPDTAISRIIRGIENRENIIIIGFHRFIENLETHPNACAPEDFEEILEFIDSTNLKVVTLKNAVDKFCSN